MTLMPPGHMIRSEGYPFRPCATRSNSDGNVLDDHMVTDKLRNPRSRSTTGWPTMRHGLEVVPASQRLAEAIVTSISWHIIFLNRSSLTYYGRPSEGLCAWSPQENPFGSRELEDIWVKYPLMSFWAPFFVVPNEFASRPRGATPFSLPKWEAFPGDERHV